MNIKLFILLVLGIWIGMLLGISFLEAPLKFRAPNVTLPIGLGIGRLVFSALNKIEIIFSILLISWLYFNAKNLEFVPLLLIMLIPLLLAIQTFWLLSVLDIRAELQISGHEIVKSYHHLYYVVIEVLKVGLLIFGYIKIYNFK